MSQAARSVGGWPRTIAFVLLWVPGVLLCFMVIHEFGAGEAWKALGHVPHAVTVTALALACLRWPAAVGKLLTVVGAGAIVVYPLQGLLRGLGRDSVLEVELIVILPALLAGVLLWLAARRTS
jgi:hypothetical protein